MNACRAIVLLTGLVLTGTTHATYGLGEPLPLLAAQFEREGSAVAVGDVTGDGRDDIVVAIAASFNTPAEEMYRLHIFVQQPDGSLAPSLLRDYGSDRFDVGISERIALLDADGDGVRDIIVGHRRGISLLYAANDFLQPVEWLSGNRSWVRAMDADGDGRDDLVSFEQSGGINNYIYIHYGNDSGLELPTLFAVTRHLFRDAHAADLNNDGWNDLALSPGSGAMIYHGTGPRGFKDEPLLLGWGDHAYKPGLALGDFNRDGLTDIAMPVSPNFPNNGPNNIRIHHQIPSPSNSGRSRTPNSRIWVEDHLTGISQLSGLLASDLDGDGYDDIIATSAAVDFEGKSRLATLFTSLAPDSYASFQARFVSGVGHIATGDIDGDGVQDIVATDTRDGAIVLHGTHAPELIDLAVDMDVGSSTVTVTVTNRSTTTDFDGVRLETTLSGTKGSAVIGLPAQNCHWRQDGNNRGVECNLNTIRAGETVMRIFPYTVPTRVRKFMEVEAKATSFGAETIYHNNIVGSRALR